MYIDMHSFMTTIYPNFTLSGLINSVSMNHQYKNKT